MGRFETSSGDRNVADVTSAKIEEWLHQLKLAADSPYAST